MRMIDRYVAVLFAAVALCPWQASASVRIVDRRTEEAKKGHRDSNFSAIAFLPDKSIKPGALEQLQSQLDARVPASEDELVVDELSVVDVFLFRAKVASSQMRLLGVLFDEKTDWSFVRSNDVPMDQDSVLCVLRGTFGWREVKASAVVPYKLPLLATLVRSNPKFREAVTACIGQLADKVSVVDEKLPQPSDAVVSPSD